MISYGLRAANSSSPRMRRAKTPFARCPCTKPAIFAGAVNHPHHINPMNHSSDKCHPSRSACPAAVGPPARPPARRPSAVMRPKFLAQSHTNLSQLSCISRTCARSCQPLHPPQKGLQPRPVLPPGATTRAAFASRPSAVMRHQNFFTQSLVNSRELSSQMSTSPRTCAHTCATPPSAAEGPPARPVPGPRRARSSPASRLPCCAQNFLPNLTHSLAISRVTLLHLSFLSTPSTALKVLLTSIPLETGTLRANQTTVSWPSRLPLPNTKYAIRRPTCSFPLARACTTV